MTARINSSARTNTDIIKQVNGRRYKVENQDGTGYVNLVGRAIAASGEATINATDSVGGTYWVTKLTNHKATLVRNSGTAFANGQAVKWTFSGSPASDQVTIDNG